MLVQELRVHELLHPQDRLVRVQLAVSVRVCMYVLGQEMSVREEPVIPCAL